MYLGFWEHYLNIKLSLKFGLMIKKKFGFVFPPKYHYQEKNLKIHFILEA